MGLDHHAPGERDDCIWIMVCGVKIFLPLARLGSILQCPIAGTELEQIDVDMNIDARDEVTHRFMLDDIRVLRSNQLRPQARLLHRALIRSITPRTGSYEEVRKVNFQALYAIYSSQPKNWASWIMTEFMDVNRKRKYKTFHYGAYIMRILSAFGVPMPDSEYSTISELGPRTLGLMGLEKNPRNLGFMPFAQWQTHRAQGILQPAAHHEEIHEEEEEEEGSGSEGIQVITPNMSSRDAMVALSQNQSKLRTQIKENQRRTEKKFNSIRGFLNKIWDKLGCTGSSSTAAHNPAPFQWSPSSGNDGGEEVADSESESL